MGTTRDNVLLLLMPLMPHAAADDTDDEEEYCYLQANLCSKCECENIIRLAQVEIPRKQPLAIQYVVHLGICQMKSVSLFFRVCVMSSHLGLFSSTGSSAAIAKLWKNMTFVQMMLVLVRDDIEVDDYVGLLMTP